LGHAAAISIPQLGSGGDSAAALRGSQLQPNDIHAYTGIARLKPGVSLSQANADVGRMLPIWITEYGTSGPVLQAAHFAPSLRPLKQDVVGDVGPLLWVLMGTIASC